MATTHISLRSARARDAEAIADAYEETWLYAYQGIIPHLPLMQMISRRGPGWWQDRLRRGMPAQVLSFDGEIAGYATYGASRMRGTPYGGEIFELYVRPGFHGAGFGRRLYTSARDRLRDAGLNGLFVWALADNEPACDFYRHLGGRPVSEGLETYPGKNLRKIGFAWR